MTIRNLLYFAVPGFVMVTGALLLDSEKKISYRRLFGRYLGRIAGALVVFTFVYEIYSTVFNTGTLGLSVIKTGSYKILTNTSWSHMWYLYMLIGIYFLLPLYKKAVEGMAAADLRYLLIVYFVFQSIVPGLSEIFQVKIGWYICVQTIYPFYLFMGYALHKGAIRFNGKQSAVLFILGAALIGGLTMYSYSGENQAIRDYVASYSSVPVILEAVGFYGLMIHCSEKTEGFLIHIINRIDQNSFGIYLIHMIFINVILLRLHINPYRYGRYTGVLICSIVVFVLSWIVTAILRRIPGIRKIL